MSFVQVMSNVARHRLIPPHHPEATTGAEAYVLDELMPAVLGLELTLDHLLAARECLQAGDKARR